MKLYLMVTAMIGHPWELPSVPLYWTLRYFGVPGLEQYQGIMMERTLEGILVVIPALMLALLCKRIVLHKLLRAIPVKAVQARIA